MPGSIWEANPLLTKSGMGAERYTFDTNILFYAIEYSTDRKHALARRLVGLANPKQVPVLLQTLGELCNSFTKRRRDLLPQAEEFVQSATELFEIVAADSADLLEALHAHQHHGLPYWDAVLWATTRRLECSLFLTEDLQDGRTLGGVTFRNPFTMTEAELTQLLL